ncbi:MAG: inositol monophosphatase [Clostridia bacterium]|nr:inositol monophosphatase [Clostridia bacterium]
MDKALDGILRRAARLMLDFENPQVFAKGGHADFVTEADVAVQAFLLEELARAYPGAAFFAEEAEGQTLGDGLTFIIDPIDGTTNFFRRRRCSAISVGAVEGKMPVFGAIYDPYRDEMYHAERGRGAYCGDVRLHVSDTPMEKAVIGLGSAPYYSELFELTGRTVGRLLPQIADFRRTGSACIDLCDVAAGRSDGHFEWRLQPWDYCAATLIVEEAGGRCGSILGGEVVYDRAMPHLAANARIFDQLQMALQEIERQQ